MHEGATDGVRGWEGDRRVCMREQQIKWEGDSEGMHEGATDGVRGWEGDRRVCMREQQIK